jgi:hypothetical protein
MIDKWMRKEYFVAEFYSNILLTLEETSSSRNDGKIYWKGIIHTKIRLKYSTHFKENIFGS